METRWETPEKKAVRLLSEHPEWKLYSGSAGDQDDFEEGVLCALDLDYEDENIVVIKDAYY